MPVFQVNVQVWVNYIATSLACTADVPGVNQVFRCSDGVDTVNVNAGDIIFLIVTTSNPSTGSIVMNVSLEKQ